MQHSGPDFYRLQSPAIASLMDIRDESQFVPFPDDWHVVITDVAGSTAAIRAGRYKDVNAMGATSITAVLNALDREELPYVFGGDGATFVVHASRLEKTIFALNGVRNLAASAFQLDLRVGSVPLVEIRAQGTDVKVCRYAVTPGYTQALFFGGGLDTAERLIKEDTAFRWQARPDPSAEADPTGLECRWDEIPAAGGEAVALLVKSLDGSSSVRLQTYREIIALVNRIYKVETEGHPLAIRNMKTTLSLKKLSIEHRIRNFGRPSGQQEGVRSVWFKAFLGRIFEFTEKTVWPMTWTGYKQTVRENSDYRKFDDMLRLILSGNAAQREELHAVLDSLHRAGRIVYGTHVSPATLITCMVLDRGTRHCHFVDGSAGGYALAAAGLKAQLKALSAG